MESENIKLFKSLFRGREDVYPRMFTDRKGKRGYSPVCRNRFKNRCDGKCYKCTNSDYVPFTDEVVRRHLKGLEVIGIYPLLPDETSYFIAADFDNHSGDHDPLRDAKEFFEVCQINEIPCYIERSRSGKGYHAWIFFDSKITAWKSRLVMFALLQEAQAVNEDTELKTFDRLFPNQNKLSGKGFGNLIALPLQGKALQKGNTTFLDMANGCNPYPDQWDFLSKVERASEAKLNHLIKEWNLKKEDYKPINTEVSIETNQEGLEKVLGCEFIIYCKESARTLSEPLWYAMISNLARFKGGAEKIHEYSKDYPNYSRDETDRKIEHALNASNPHSCEYIGQNGFKCSKSCGVKSPAGLSQKSKSTLKKEGKEIEASFLKLDDGRIAEQIYNTQLVPPHQFVTLTDKGFEYFPQMVLRNKIYVPAGVGLVEKKVVLLPSKAIDYGSDSKLSDEIQSFIHRYLDIPTFYEKLSVLYARYSWIHDQFSVTSYLRARGDYGTGKSRLLQTVGSIAYKPMFCGGSTTSSPIFRLIELFKGSLILDEADFKSSDLHTDIIKILNQGYMEGIPVLRSEGGGQKWDVKSYDVYGCKIIATRKKYHDQALESRMLTIEMASTKRDDILLILTDDFWKEAQEIRNKLLYWRFMKYGNAELNQSHKIPSIENRLNQIIIPILSITDDQELIRDIKESIKEYQKEMVKDRGLDVEASVIEAILKFKDDKDYERTLKKIADETNKLLGYSENDRNRLTPKRVGRIVRDSLKLKTDRGKDGYYVIWNEESIKGLKGKYGLDEEPKEDEEQSKVMNYDC